MQIMAFLDRYVYKNPKQKALKAAEAKAAGGDREPQTLEDELATLQHYLEIESVRFGERLAVEFVCPPSLNAALVPGFLLQPLIEN
ncbi:hypothetical protein EON62_06335, partial [archaeon]